MTESPSNFFAEFSDALLLSFLRHSVTRDRGLIDHARRFPPPWSVEDLATLRGEAVADRSNFLSEHRETSPTKSIYLRHKLQETTVNC
jgi:hypothetical protein